MDTTFKKKGVLPIISEIIDSELLAKMSVSRDEIARALLEHPVGKKKVEDAVSSAEHFDLFKKAGNMVDWFSAEIKRGSKIAVPYIEKYCIVKFKVNGRKICNY